jgi:hypothetical protein
MTKATAFLGWGILLASWCGARADGFAPLRQLDGEYRELAELAVSWSAAVASQQTAAVVGYALPEAQGLVKSELGDPTSSLHEALYSSGTRNLLQDPKRKTLIIPHEDLVEYGQGTTICFLAADHREPSWPVSREGLNALSREPGALCIFTFRAEERRWFVSYDFAHQDEDAAISWWVDAHFDATGESIAMIPAAQLEKGWRYASPLTESAIEKFRDSEENDAYAEHGFRFELESDLNGDGRAERVLAGVYQTETGETGRFILVLAPNPDGGWEKAFVSSLPAHQNFSALLQTDGEVRWSFCMMCGN